MDDKVLHDAVDVGVEFGIANQREMGVEISRHVFAHGALAVQRKEIDPLADIAVSDSIDVILAWKSDFYCCNWLDGHISSCRWDGGIGGGHGVSVTGGGDCDRLLAKCRCGSTAHGEKEQGNTANGRAESRQWGGNDGGGTEFPHWAPRQSTRFSGLRSRCFPALKKAGEK